MALYRAHGRLSVGVRMVEAVDGRSDNVTSEEGKLTRGTSVLVANVEAGGRRA